jgi:hypothetical protein
MKINFLAAILFAAQWGCSASSTQPTSSPDRHVLGGSSAALSPPPNSPLGATPSFLLSAGPEGYWNLGDFDSTMRDYSSHQINGTYQDNPLLAQPGAIADDNDTSVFFDGNGYAEVPTHEYYSLTRFWDSFLTNVFQQGEIEGWGGGWASAVTTSSHYFTFGLADPHVGQAAIEPFGASGTFEQVVVAPGTSLVRGQMQVRATWDQHASRGPLQPVSLVAHQVDEYNMARVELLELDDATLELDLIEVINGQNTYLDRQLLNEVFTLGDWWFVRFQFDGPNLAARAWKAGTPEPTDWQAMGTATSAIAGSVAIRSANSASAARPNVYFAEPSVQTLGFSVSAFIKFPDPKVFPQSKVEVYPLSKASHFSNFFQGQGNQEYYFRYILLGDGYHLKAYVFNPEGKLGAGQDFPNTELNDAPIQFNKWYHFVMMLDPGDSNDTEAGISLYVNGKLHPVVAGSFYKGDQACTTACVDDQCTGQPDCWTISPLPGDAPLQIGRGESGSGDDARFTGTVDEVAVYGRKLTCEEVANVYNSSCQQSDAPLLSGVNAFASSSLPLNPPQAAVDGQLATFWSSSTDSTPQFFRVDLGSPRDISMIRLNWKDFPATFQVFTSTDGNIFTEVTGVANGQPGVQDITIAGSARFIHINLITPSASLYSLFDFQVFACTVAPAGCTNEWPVAVVGSQQRVVPGQLVHLDGSNSFDPDPPDTLPDGGAGNAHSLSYAWSLTPPGGSAARLSDASVPLPTFTPDVIGNFSASLVVTDLGMPAATSYPATTVVTVVRATFLVNQDLAEATAIAQALSANDVTSRGDLNAFVHLLEEASAAMKAGNFRRAERKMQSALVRTDGWSLRGTPDTSGPGRDWIVAKGPAMSLYSLLNEALGALRTHCSRDAEHTGSPHDGERARRDGDGKNDRDSGTELWGRPECIDETVESEAQQ